MSERIAILDFETTGMSPAHGARAAEVGIVMIEDGRIVDRYQSLMNAGQHMPSFITQLTGITTAMLQAAAPAEEVMREAAAFVGSAPLVAHNASFDSKFWRDELERAGRPASQELGTGLFACTVLLSRRLYPEAPSHSLGKIVRHLQLPPADKAHRALADAEMTAHLLLRMQADLRSRWHIPDPSHALLSELQTCQRKHLGRWLSTTSARQTQPQLPELASMAPVRAKPY
ncbi:DNA polymerase-3 subunit epsilon [Comamonas odontotermitis]|uniref:DNA polymerase-3 subunit epsilon n=1 Tax=Comamonas odontotermitis TaxID=379895 RepID=A0ABR6RCZ0_9BURK|nr:3'-5' exonuclease [Comamonas odontotermitis]MBB6577021.1 DNA polymerase-3 subunit epsilon [Comamonas odontotermitis]